MKINQIAIQLYTIRDYLNSTDEIYQSLKKLAEIGYQAVQPNFPMETISAADFARLCQDLGLTICATHDSVERLRTSPEQVVETLKILNCQHTAFPFPHGIDLASQAEVDAMIDDLENTGEVLQAAGMTLSYHHHHHEFRRLEGQLILDRILAKPHIQAELDTHWVQRGGGNPVEWCQKMKGKLPLLHLKDYRINENNEVEFAEVGYGNLDFPSILAAAEQAGCQWFIVEQDLCPGNPFDSLKLSFDTLQGFLA